MRKSKSEAQVRGWITRRINAKKLAQSIRAQMAWQTRRGEFVQSGK